jgi:hypothetical protein
MRAVSILLPWVVSRSRSYGFLWAGSIIQKHVRKDNPTPAYSPVSDRRRLTALVEVHWARGVQAPMPQISGPNSQENRIIETCKEKGCAVSIQEIAARRKLEMEHLTLLTAPWTDSRPHARIVNELSGGNQYNATLENFSPSTVRRGAYHSAMFKTSYDEGCQLHCGRPHSQLTVNLNRRISDGITDMKSMTSSQVFKTTIQYR